MGPNFDWLDYVRSAGGAVAPLLLGALFWMDRERRRLLAELSQRDTRLADLTERLITVTVELRTLFSKRGSGR